jgi:cyanate permease
VDGQLIGFAFAVFLYVMIGKGKNWARIVLLVFTVIGFGLIAFVYQELMQAPLLMRLAGFGRPLCNAIALYLVFIPGSEWFKPR